MIGVFTTVKVVNGNPLFFEQHQKRLTAHAKKLNLGSFSLNKLIIKKYLQENNLSDCALKITITKENKHTSIAMQHRLLPDPSDIKLITVTDTRTASKTLKTTDRTINEQAKKLAVANGADDAVFVQNNKLIESTIANIFSINHQGQIITPPLECRGLKGIIRKMIMQNLDVVEEEIPENTTSPLVLTNSLRIQKVTHLNGKKLQDAEKLFQCIKKIKNSLEGKYIDNMRVRENSFFKQLSTWLEPEKVFLTLFKNAPSSFWLDSSLTNDFSRYSYMGIPSEEISYSLKANLVTVKKNGTNKLIHQNIFDYLTEQLKLEEIKTPPLPFPFVGGYVGYFGYELKVLTGAKTKYQSPYPDSLWYKVNNFIAFDHQEKKVYLVSLKNNPAWFTKIEQALKKITQVKNTKNIHQKITFKLTRDKNRYLKDIQKCKEYLQKGESYQ
ncbi:MAG TPA: aminotransferase class IV, partial [Patescibacteria group bacterium]